MSSHPVLHSIGAVLRLSVRAATLYHCRAELQDVVEVAPNQHRDSRITTLQKRTPLPRRPWPRP